MTILFDYHINFFSDSDNRTNLPFSIFGMSQQGLSHQSYSIGNQDAACIYVGRNFIAGAVADGCTSGKNLNGMSSNQVGANILSYLSVRVMRKLILKKQIQPEQIAIPFQLQLIRDLRRTLNSFNPWKYERQAIIRNFFASTAIVFIITHQKYAVLSCGDGDAFINGDKKELTASGGKYFANNLFDLKHVQEDQMQNSLGIQFNCIDAGSTSKLDNLLIATDGFIDNDVEENDCFNRFFFEKGKSKKTGFVDRKTDFRADFLENITEAKDGKIWPLDDATFISVQRNNP